MSQDIFNNIDPNATTGLMLAGLLDDFKDAVVSGFSGTSRPSNLQAGGFWVDTTLQVAPTYTWSLKIYTGTTDLEVFKISILSSQSGFTSADSLFTVKKVSADTAGAILNISKNRTDNSGQVLSGDTIGQIKISGRTNGGADTVVAYIRATATENQTASNRGSSLTLAAVPAGTNLLYEHLRLISGVLETQQPLKAASTIYGTDTVASAASLVVSSAKIISEITGIIPTTIHGIAYSATNTGIKYIHNNTNIEILVKHNSTGASAGNRFSLLSGADLKIPPQCCVGFFYCTTDLAWKYLSGAVAQVHSYIDTFPEGYSEWVSPITGNVVVATHAGIGSDTVDDFSDSAFSKAPLKGALTWGFNNHGQLGVGSTTPKSTPTAVVGGIKFSDVNINSSYGSGISDTGTAYAWGLNTDGELGVGDVVPRSSPVAVLGGLRFTRFYSGESSYGLTYSGVSYAWGLNSSGQLGLGDVASRSSPVAILGGLKFSNIFKGTVGEQIAFGLERDTGILYAWGANSNGQLGVGNIASRSSPVAVLGGLKFRKVAVGSGCAVGLDHTGVAYAWGLNSSGELGLGDLIPRSSPVAVLGGLVFRDVHVIPNSSNSFYGITEYGDLYAWGGNINGQLGIGSTADKSSPTLIVGGLRFEKLAKLCSGNSSVVAIQKGTGIAYSWGNNGSGELGVGDIVPRSSPVAVLGGLKFSNVILGDTFAYGEASDGRHYAWGVNTDGQLGDGTTVAKSSPVLVQGLTQPYFVAPIIKVVPVVKGSTYKIKVGGGVSFFGDTNIGTNSRSITIAYEI